MHSKNSPEDEVAHGNFTLFVKQKERGKIFNKVQANQTEKRSQNGKAKSIKR